MLATAHKAAGARLCRALALALIALPAWGATWYVRPAEGTYGTSDGTSYANAFDGFADIVWGIGGVQAGDTLKVCGTFTQASANTANSNLAMMQVQASGSVGQEIIIDGDCSADGDLSVAVIDGDYTSGSVIRTLANTYLRFRNLDLSGAKNRGMTLYSAAASETATAKHITIESTVTISDIHTGVSPTMGVEISGTNVTIGDYSTTGRKINLFDIGSDAIFCYSCGNLLVDGAYIREISEDDSDGDCVQLQRSSDGDKVLDLECDKTNKDSKQCVVASTLTAQSQVMLVDRMRCLMTPGTAGIGVYAEGQMTVRNSWIENAATYGMTVALNNSAKLTATSNIIKNPGTGCFSVRRTSAGGAADLYHNICHMDGATYGINATANTATVNAKNNSITGTATYGIYRGASGTADDYNNVYGPATPYSDNGSAGNASANDIALDPKFIGGTNPTTAEGFRLSASSPLAGAGTDLGDEIADFFGDYMYSGKWDIGAFRRDSCYRRSRDGKLDMARTRAQVVSRCLGIPGRYPEGL